MNMGELRKITKELRDDVPIVLEYSDGLLVDLDNISIEIKPHPEANGVAIHINIE